MDKFFKGIDPDAGRIYNLSNSSSALFLCLLEDPFALLTASEEESRSFYNDIKFYQRLYHRTGNIHHFPEPDGLDNIAKRAEVILNIKEGDSIILSVESYISPSWSKESLPEKILSLSKGDEFERDSVNDVLIDLGYRRVSLVVDKGEFSLRGWILDIYPINMDEPVRIEFYGDEIEKMRTFDIESQRSLKELERVTVLPVIEPDMASLDLEALSFPRIYYTDTAMNLLQKKGISFHSSCLLSRLDLETEGSRANLLSLRGLGIYHDERKSLSEFGKMIKSLSRENRIIFVSSTQGQAMRLKELLFNEDIVAPLVALDEVISFEGNVCITIGELSAGLFIEGLIILTEREIFGERPRYRPMKRSKVTGLLSTLNDISPHDYVVHVDHGIGRFIGIEKRIISNDSNSYAFDFAIIEYAGGDRLYLPLYNIEKLKKYSAGEGIAPSLDRLGGKTWQRKKAKVGKAVKEMAQKLLKLYAEREIAKGYSFSLDNEMHQEFYDFFPYEETPDQLRSFEEIKEDMESDRPMDRLLCGDVGYGKTEVAMRAAFKAVYDGKQVAVLVPTTILCEQHYLNFVNRFKAFPVRIDYLSRFKSKKGQEAVIKALRDGEIDIIIGTQALLRKDINFYDLGLLIIDEEHRFGVAQKERIKELKKGVDVLTMTATPIPRTLQMALSGIRKISLIETPPEERIAVRSIVSVFNTELIKDAIERELNRGGQVLFVHNFVHDIDDIAGMIRGLFPNVSLRVAHGQMQTQRLEKIMLDFMKGDVKILVSTNIIGSGIDIPTANTIIINRADRLGLADLYQLKGRVGRSNVRAYAYFLIPGEDIITGEAKKRLEAIKEMSYLGAGLRVAMKDLEIRGAGNLLGPEQSGHIHAVGFDTYVEMLEKVISELKGEEIKEEIEPILNLNVEAVIPEDYIEDVSVRLGMYRRIASSRTEEALQDLALEMKDRFGDLPIGIENLINIMRLKLIAKRLTAKGIYESNGRLRFSFFNETPVTVEALSNLRKRFHRIKYFSDGFEVPLIGDLSTPNKGLEKIEKAIYILRCLEDLLSSSVSSLKYNF